MKIKLLLISLSFFLVNALFAQDTTKTKETFFNYDPDNYDLVGLFAKNGAEPKIDTNWAKTKWSIFPAIAVNPAIGTGYGFGVTAGKYLGDPKTTRLSAFSSTPIYTSKGQLFIPLRLTVFTKDEKYFLNGTYIWRHFPLGTYGLGTNTPRIEGDMLDSKTVTFWQTVNRKIGDGIFIGAGYALDYYYDIHDTRSEIITDFISDNRDRKITPDDVIKIAQTLDDYGYEIKVKDMVNAAKFINDWNNHPEKSAEEMQKEHLPTAYQRYYEDKFGKPVEEIEDVKDGKEIASSLMLNFIYDKRDNQLNPYTGIYFNTYARLSTKWLGSTFNYQFLAYDYRQYWEMPWLNKNILGIWATGAFTFGDPVYTGLPAIASDPFLRTGRGWTAGRLKGMDMMYTEVEYRMPVYDLMGVVAFVNGSQFSDIDRNYGKLKLGYGFGFRMKLNKESRSNFALDFGWNEDGYAGFYMQLNETF